MTNIIKADICIIGAGSGGLSVASGASQLGKSTVLVEGGNVLALHAEDGAGRTTDQDLHLVIDTLPPELAARYGATATTISAFFTRS